MRVGDSAPTRRKAREGGLCVWENWRREGEKKDTEGREERDLEVLESVGVVVFVGGGSLLGPGFVEKTIFLK